MRKLTNSIGALWLRFIRLLSGTRPVELTPIPAEHKEQAWEYQQVAGLLCMDIDVLNDCVDESMSKEDINLAGARFGGEEKRHD